MKLKKTLITTGLALSLLVVGTASTSTQASASTKESISVSSFSEINAGRKTVTQTKYYKDNASIPTSYFYSDNDGWYGTFYLDSVAPKANGYYLATYKATLQQAVQS